MVVRQQKGIFTNPCQVFNADVIHKYLMNGMVKRCYSFSILVVYSGFNWFCVMHTNILQTMSKEARQLISQRNSIIMTVGLKGMGIILCTCNMLASTGICLQALTSAYLHNGMANESQEGEILLLEWNEDLKGRMGWSKISCEAFPAICEYVK